MNTNETWITPTEVMTRHEVIQVAEAQRGEQAVVILRYLINLAARGFSKLASYGADVYAVTRGTGFRGYPYI